MRIAALTSFVDDDVFIPIWERYYAPLFDYTEKIQLHDFGTQNNNSIVRQRISEVIRDYDVLMYCDLDELIIPDPLKYANLREYIERRFADKELPNVVTSGHDVIHTKGLPPLDFSKPILPQRERMRKNDFYTKPLITRIMLKWCDGFHVCNTRIPPDPELVLFHLQLADRQTAATRLRKRRTLTEEQLDMKLYREFELYGEAVPVHERSKIADGTIPIPERFKIA